MYLALCCRRQTWACQKTRPAQRRALCAGQRTASSWLVAVIQKHARDTEDGISRSEESRQSKTMLTRVRVWYDVGGVLTATIRERRCPQRNVRPKLRRSASLQRGTAHHEAVLFTIETRALNIFSLAVHDASSTARAQEGASRSVDLPPRAVQCSAVRRS
jgi:hypothetical protein